MLKNCENLQKFEENLSRMEVVNIPEKGRGLIATQDHKEGKVLLEEEPICSAQFRIWARKNGVVSEDNINPCGISEQAKRRIS